MAVAEVAGSVLQVHARRLYNDARKSEESRRQISPGTSLPDLGEEQDEEPRGGMDSDYASEPEEGSEAEGEEGSMDEEE